MMTMLHNSTISSQPTNPTDIDIYSFRYWLNGIAASIVCAIGLLGNALNVLIQLKMFKSTYRKTRSTAPTTLFLLVMAICDVLVLLIYITYDIVCIARPSRRPLIVPEDVKGHEGTFTYFLFFVWYFPANIFITSSNWCIVSVMCFRFVAVYFPLKAKTWCSLLRARNAVILILIFSVLVTVPDCFTIKIQKSNTSAFEFTDTELSNNEVFIRTYFAFLEAMNSFLPFTVCTFLSVMLIRTLNRKDSALTQARNYGGKARQSDTNKQRRISTMLLGITSWFIFCTCPSFVCRIVTLLKDRNEQTSFYQIFRGVADFFLLLNHTANFVLYAATSDIYRRCFMDLVLCRNRRELERQSTITLLNASTRASAKHRHRDSVGNGHYTVVTDVNDNDVEAPVVSL